MSISYESPASWDQDDDPEAQMGEDANDELEAEDA